MGIKKFKKKLIITISLLFLLVFSRVKPAQSNDLPGAEGFSPSITKPSSYYFAPSFEYEEYDKYEEYEAKNKREVQESIKAENKLNANRKAKGKGKVTLIYHDDKRLFALNTQLRDEFYHAEDLNSEVPETLTYEQLARLGQSKKRLEILRNRTILEESFVEKYGKDLRRHVLDRHTITFPGTYGVNRQERGEKTKILLGCHYFNTETDFNAFFEETTNDGVLKFVTGFKLNRDQMDDLMLNSNID